MEDRERTTQIQALKAIFDKAKTAPKMGEPGWNVEFEGDEIGAVTLVGKQHLDELKEEIYPYLNHEDPDFRIEAIATLGFATRLDLPEFKDKAYEIWLHDPDERVKDCALRTWAGYYKDCQDPKALKEILPVLYKILINHRYTIQHRVTALVELISSADYQGARELYQMYYLGDLESQEELDKAIDWERVNRIMKTYASEALKEYPK